MRSFRFCSAVCARCNSSTITAASMSNQKQRLTSFFHGSGQIRRHCALPRDLLSVRCHICSSTTQSFLRRIREKWSILYSSTNDSCWRFRLAFLMKARCFAGSFTLQTFELVSEFHSGSLSIFRYHVILTVVGPRASIRLSR